MREFPLDKHERTEADDRLDQILATTHAELVDAIATQQDHARTMTLIPGSGTAEEPTKTIDRALWSYKEIAAYINVRPDKVRWYRKHGLLPTPDHVEGGKPYWYSDTVRAWMASRPSRREP